MLVEQTQRAADELQHKFDDRVRHVAGALGLRAGEEDEIVILRKRIEDLEARIVQLEARRERSRPAR